MELRGGSDRFVEHMSHGSKSWKESSGLRHIVMILLSELVDQHLLFLWCPNSQQPDDNETADTDQLIRCQYRD